MRRAVELDDHVGALDDGLRGLDTAPCQVVVRVDLLLGFFHANDMIGAPRQRGGECFHDLVVALFPEPGSVCGGGVIWRALAEAGESVVLDLDYWVLMPRRGMAA